MIIEVEKGNETTLQQIRDLAASCGNRVEHEDSGLFLTVCVIGDTRDFETRAEYLGKLPGVRRAWSVKSDYKNIARVVRSEDGRAHIRERRPVELRGLDGQVRRFGAGKHIFVVGPDSAQNLAQTLAIAKMVRELAERFDIVDRVVLRGGAFKPRTSPTGWRGLGMKGIAILDAAREETGLPYVTEVMDHNLVDEIAGHADMLQIGTRNAQNFDLHEAVGRSGKPVILKRGFGNEAKEWFFAAEYIANQGNLDIVLCERGMKTLFVKGGYQRNHPDHNVIAHAKRQTILPIIFDPSHCSGDHQIVGMNMMAAVAHLVDGTITETLHEESFREQQLCDAAQALLMERYAKLVEAVLLYEQHVEPLVRAVSGE